MENTNLSVIASTDLFPAFTDNYLTNIYDNEEHIIQAPSLLDVILGYLYFILTAVTSVLSIIGCLIIIFSYFFIKDLRSKGRQLLVYLSFADLLTAIGNFMGITWYIFRHQMSVNSSWAFCKTHAYLTIFSSISAFLWTISIGLHLYISIVMANSTLADKCVWFFHLACWLIPAGVSTGAIIEDVVGHDDTLPFPSWCWIDPGRSDVLAWQYASGKAWEVACYIITVVLYVGVKIHLIKQMAITRNMRTFVGTTSRQASGNRNVISSVNQKLTFVPVVFILSRVWGTVRFLIGAHVHHVAMSSYTAWIVPLQGIGDSVQGFANCVMFCIYNPKVRESLARVIFHKAATPVTGREATGTSGVSHANEAFEDIY